MEAFKDCHWESILAVVLKILDEGGRRRQSNLLWSRVSSYVDVDVPEAEENYIVISDDE